MSAISGKDHEELVEETADKSVEKVTGKKNEEMVDGVDKDVSTLALPNEKPGQKRKRTYNTAKLLESHGLNCCRRYVAERFADPSRCALVPNSMTVRRKTPQLWHYCFVATTGIDGTNGYARQKVQDTHGNLVNLNLHNMAFVAGYHRDCNGIVSHICQRIRACFNPFHLRDESQSLNVQRARCDPVVLCHDHGHIIQESNCDHIPACIFPVSGSLTIQKCCLAQELEESRLGQIALVIGEENTRLLKALFDRGPLPPGYSPPIMTPNGQFLLPVQDPDEAALDEPIFLGNPTLKPFLFELAGLRREIGSRTGQNKRTLVLDIPEPSADHPVCEDEDNMENILPGTGSKKLKCDN